MLVLTAGVARLLLGKLLEHLAGTGDPVTALTDGDVQNQFIDLNRAHDIVLFRLSSQKTIVSNLEYNTTSPTLHSTNCGLHGSRECGLHASALAEGT